MCKKIKNALVALLLVFAGAYAFADKTPVENLYQYNLDNGLTLFVNENHTVPLAYIEIAVRAGATTQTPETAGLFHLYEHMMFKGNELYPDAASVQKAISDLGVASWNGTTGIDHVNYFFTVPSYELESGLAFWNAAVRTPTMDPTELENEKKVVLSEIEGDLSNPISFLQGYMNSTMFEESPYRLSPGGSPSAVANATVAQMKDMQSKYYIPANSALFVGGDVNPDEVYKLVKAIYGDWSNNGNEAPKKGPQQNKKPLSETKYVVVPYDQMSPYYSEVEVIWRGPDADYDEKDTYPADYLIELLSDPAGTFKTDLCANPNLGIPDVDYVMASYGTTRASGEYGFVGYMLSPEQSLPERVDLFVDSVKESVKKVSADKKLYTSAKAKEIVKNYTDSAERNSETAEGLLSNLRFWWTSCGTDYYYNYAKNLGKVKQTEVQKFVNEYFYETEPMVIVIVNPAIYNQTVAEYEAKGYHVVVSEDAQWWNLPQCKPNADVIASQTGTVTQAAPIYKPAKGEKVEYKSNTTIEEYKLANGIPVYVQKQKGAKVDALYVGLKGGINNITAETSGLEDALFAMMAKSSKNYPLAARQSKIFETGASISCNSRIAGSTLSLNVLDKYFYDVLPLLTDGLLNPDFDETVYENLMNDYKQSIQSMLNDPYQYLNYYMDEVIYEGHPFEVSAKVTPDSIENITLENIKKHYENLLDARQMMIVAVGNVDGKKLVKELNKTLGKIAVGTEELPAEKVIPPVTVPTGEPIRLEHPYAAGTGYVIRAFSAPSMLSDDLIPAYLAGQVYSNIMFNVVRERHGACYTPMSYVATSQASLGLEVLYKISDMNFVEYMEEARDYMANDKIIEGLGPDGEYIYTTLENRLEGYMNSYITGTYQGNMTASGVAVEYMFNLMYFGDAKYSDKYIERVLNVTAPEIIQAFKKYWIDEPSQWFLMTGPGEGKDVKF